ncbi:EF-hand domain-containing protein 1-like [Venturia canescens]|uniref:EF-hand domain-containing protein 1-like n=1 Tax=Venturia canescens TaxID=32260 RepID=UPI001C9D1B12|nr:EF-hand domain-containing protein 1-like [Venturia canescens]
MEGLPLLPGYSYKDPTISDFKLKQQFVCEKGYRILRHSDYGAGRKPNASAGTAFAPGLDADPIEYDPSLTYGRIRERPYRPVIPKYALFAQKCLNFKAFFRQGVFNSPDEHYRVRHVNIIYFLEDDTMCVMEPTIENSGFRQGRLVKRGKIPKHPDGRVYHWKDLDIGIDMVIYGIVYHTVDCDLFTREFLRSQGIDVADKEEAPVDPYTQRMLEREKYYDKAKPAAQAQSLIGDSRRRFLEFDGMVLRFDATWNDDKYQIMYFLMDDTLAVKEVYKVNVGKDPIPLLLKRTRVPKNWKNIPSNHPSVYLEIGDNEVVEYYTPKDFKIGETIFIYGRRFLLRDCDAFTRKYYAEMLCSPQPPGIIESVDSEKREEAPQAAYGSPEDTSSSSQSVVPKPPKQDLIRQISNAPQKLRYLAKMDAVHPEDEDRDFIIDYFLSDGKITISERPKRNSGRRSGCFLSKSLVPKPETRSDHPLYYTPEDLFIGAKINVHNHRFIVTGIDLYVYRFAEANPDLFTREYRDNLRNYATSRGLLADDISQQALREIERGTDTGRDSAVIGDGNECQRTDDPIRICEAELARNERGDEQQRCRELLPEPDPSPAPETCFVTELEMLPPERKKLVWADQVDVDSSGHPIVSCHPELPECTKRPPRKSCLKIRNNKNEEPTVQVKYYFYPRILPFSFIL